MNVLRRILGPWWVLGKCHHPCCCVEPSRSPSAAPPVNFYLISRVVCVYMPYKISISCISNQFMCFSPLLRDAACVFLMNVFLCMVLRWNFTWLVFPRGGDPSPQFSLSFSPLGGGMTLWRLWKMELGISLWNLSVGRYHILLCFTEQLVAWAQDHSREMWDCPVVGGNDREIFIHSPRDSKWLDSQKWWVFKMLPDSCLCLRQSKI